MYLLRVLGKINIINRNQETSQQQSVCGQHECMLLLEDSKDKKAIKLGIASEKKKKKKVRKKKEKLLRLEYPRIRFRNILNATAGLKSSFEC